LKKDYPETFLVIKARLILSENYEEASLLEQLVKCDTKYFLYIRFVEELGRQIPIFFPIQNRYEEIICKEILSRVLLPRDLFDTTNFEEFLIDVISEEKN
ncbi:MAG: hypothetical protein SGJ04_10560, partial [Bacteroidota bacterium]|nr:hypothetical protein [Bacteroidota bacterium]